MTEKQLVEQISVELDRCVSVEQAEEFIAEQIKKRPDITEKLKQLLEQHKVAIEQYNAPTQLDFSHALRYKTDGSDASVPKKIGPYELGALLGQGGFGRVFIARQTEPVQRNVAIKLIRPEMSSPQIISRFNLERQALAVMNHPNIAKVFDGGSTDDGCPYFVMELVSGLSITKYSTRQQLSVRQRLELFLDVCSGVQHAHQKGVIHRDLKPSNIIVGVDQGKPVLKVIDFGVAKAVAQDRSDETTLTKVTQMVGTSRYMSPEQASLDTLDIDTRSDIYSLGVILYELLTGSTPLDQDKIRKASFDELRRMICEEEPTKPSLQIARSNSQTGAATDTNLSETSTRVSRIVRGDLDWIVMKALEKDRERRYASASDLADDIGRFLADEPIVARPPSNVYRAKKFVSKNRVLCASVAIVFATLSIATVFSAWHAVRATRAVAAERIARVSEIKQREIAESAAIEANTARANEESKRKQAEEIRDTLINLFKSPGPFADGSKVTVREVLSNSVNTIQNRFADDPGTRFSLLYAIGESLYGLGAYDDASLALSAAVAVEEIPAELDIELLDARLQLSECLVKQDRFQPALEIAQTVYKQTVQDFGPNDRVTLRAKLTYSECLHHVGFPQESLRLAVEAHEAFEDQFDDYDSDYIRSEIDLAAAYTDNYLTGKAIRLLRTVVDKRIEQFGESNLQTLAVKTKLAYVLSHGTSADRTEARQIASRFLATADLVMEDGHPEVLRCQSILATVHAADREYSAAIELQQQVVHTAIEEMGEKHSFVIAGMLNLAKYFRLNRDFEKASAELDFVEQNALLPGSLAMAKYGRVQILMDEGEFYEAKNLLETVLQQPKHAHERSNSTAILLNRQLAICYFELKEDDKSIQHFLRTLQDLTDSMGEVHPKSSMMYRYLGVLHERKQQPAEAIVYYKKAHEVHAQLYGPGNDSTIEALITLGMTYRTVRKMDEHARLVSEAVRLSDEFLSDSAISGHKARFNLAAMYRYQKRFTDATPLLTRIMNSRSKVHPLDRNHSVFEEATNELASNYMFRRDKENAAIWFPELFDQFREKLADDPNQFASYLVYVTTDLNKYGLHAIAETALLESLEIREKLMPGNWLLDNTRSVLGETKLLHVQGLIDEQIADNPVLGEVKKLLTESYDALVDKADSIPDKYRKTRLSSAADRLVKYYSHMQDDEQVDVWIRKLADVRKTY